MTLVPEHTGQIKLPEQRKELPQCHCEALTYTLRTFASSTKSSTVFSKLLDIWTVVLTVARPLPSHTDTHPCLERESNPRSPSQSAQDRRRRPPWPLGTGAVWLRSLVTDGRHCKTPPLHHTSQFNPLKPTLISIIFKTSLLPSRKRVSPWKQISWLMWRK